jgi:hypothetical protein
MSIWSDAGAIIDAQFADEAEPNIIYTGGGLTAEEIPAIWSDVPAPGFEGPGSTLRTVIYEVPQSSFTEEPENDDTFTHRTRRWSVENVTRRDDIGKWELIVADIGEAP